MSTKKIIGVGSAAAGVLSLSLILNGCAERPPGQFHCDSEDGTRHADVYTKHGHRLLYANDDNSDYKIKFNYGSRPSADWNAPSRTVLFDVARDFCGDGTEIPEPSEIYRRTRALVEAAPSPEEGM